MVILLTMCFIVFALVVSCECVLYLIRRSVSSVPSWVDVVRAFLVGFLPLAVPAEPRFPLQHLGVKGDTVSLVVHLLAAEALVACHERRTGQSAASTVVGAGVIVVCHVFPFACCVLYVSHYIYFIVKSTP